MLEENKLNLGKHGCFQNLFLLKNKNYKILKTKE